MTDREKAYEISQSSPIEEGIWHYATAEIAALEMAQWKDQQFKEYLEKKYKIAQDAYMRSSDQSEDYTCGRADILVDIINELFGETEQDNSDRRE